MKSTRTLVLLAVFAILPLNLFAQASLGFCAGTDYGVGITGQAGSYNMKIEGGAGFMPIFFYATVTGGSDITELWFPFTIGGKINIAITDEKDPDRMAVDFGINYNSIMRLGIGGGVDYTVSLKPDIILSGGVQIYPDAKSGLLDKVNEGRAYPYSDMTITLAEFHPYLGLSVLF